MYIRVDLASSSVINDKKELTEELQRLKKKDDNIAKQ